MREELLRKGTFFCFSKLCNAPFSKIDHSYICFCGQCVLSRYQYAAEYMGDGHFKIIHFDFDHCTCDREQIEIVKPTDDGRVDLKASLTHMCDTLVIVGVALLPQSRWHQTANAQHAHRPRTITTTPTHWVLPHIRGGVHTGGVCDTRLTCPRAGRSAPTRTLAARTLPTISRAKQRG